MEELPVSNDELEEFFYLSTDEEHIIYILYLKRASSRKDFKRTDLPLAEYTRKRFDAIFASNPKKRFCILVNVMPIQRQTNGISTRKAQKIYASILRHPQVASAAFVINGNRRFIFAFNRFMSLVNTEKEVRGFTKFDECVQWIQEQSTLLQKEYLAEDTE